MESIHWIYRHFKAVGKAGKVLEYTNKAAPFLAAVAVAVDCARVVYNVMEDKKNGTTRNTVTTVTTTAAAWGCGYGGAVGGEYGINYA